jgi:hypothetical protein
MKLEAPVEDASLRRSAACLRGRVRRCSHAPIATWNCVVDCDEHRAQPEKVMLRKLALTQGLFYLATGIWPLLDMVSFQLVTGPKTDLWLVRTVGVLVTVVGGVLLLGYWSRRVTDELVVLAMGCALGLAAIDLVYSLSGRISAVYLADAAAEIGLAGLWAYARLRP